MSICISVVSPPNLESGHFSEIGSSQVSSRIWQMPLQLQYVQSITDKTNTADLSSGMFAILLGVTLKIIQQNSLPFNKFSQKLANTDITKEALNCTASL